MSDAFTRSMQQAHAAHDAGRLADAAAHYRAALSQNAASWEALFGLACALQDAGDNAAAEPLLRRVVEIAPTFAGGYCNLGKIHQDAARHADALPLYRRATELAPQSAVVWNNLCNALQNVHDLSAAADAGQKAVALDPNFAGARNNLGNVLMGQGRVAEAVIQYDAASRSPEADPGKFANLLQALQGLWPIDSPAILAHARRFADAVAGPLRAERRPFPPRTGPDLPLRVGFVSADFRTHAVAHFLLPLIEQLDRRVAKVFCYSSTLHADATTTRFRALADAWCDALTLSDQQLHARIRGDAIDILIDLSGHTGGSRLRVFAARAAPVQIAWLGYPGTTGLDTLDHRIVDPLTDPPGVTDLYHTEPLLRIAPPFLCYRPPDELRAMDVPPLPMSDGRPPTFISLNRFAKISPLTIDLWRDILAKVPRSRLILKCDYAADQATADLMRHRFGPLADRVTVHTFRRAFADHIALYADADIALDPFPYHGTTTTCEALLLGRPVVSLAGPTHVSRVGVSLLTAVGLPHLAAPSPREYVDAATRLATDTAGTIALSAQLRPRLLASPLTDAPAFARRFEAALQSAWDTREQPTL